MNFRDERPLVWLSGEIKTPPLSINARIEAGYLLRLLQRGEKLRMPQSRPMSIVGRRCHELRITDETLIWRVIYRIDIDAIVILEVFDKKTNRTPKQIIHSCKKRLKNYDEKS
jgi:phage-related protein